MNGNQNKFPSPAPLPEEPTSSGQDVPTPEQGMPVSQQGGPEVRPPQAPPQVPPMPSPPPAPQRFQPSGPTPSIPGTPPPPDIGIRTMASDLSSLKSSGGLEAKPKTFKPEEFSKEPTFEVSKPKKGPEGEMKTAKPKEPPKSMFIALGIVGFVVVAGLVIYFFVMPLIFPKAEPITEPAPVVETPPAALEPTVTPLIHQSYFVAPVASTVAMNLNNLNLAEVNSALNASATDMGEQTVREVTFTVSGNVPEAADFLSIAFPELNKDFLTASFERDFTTFIYRDVNGFWPGYIFRLSPGSSLDQVASTVTSIESSANIPELYLSDIAPSSAGFKDGLKVGDLSARYLAFSVPGASFNYVWLNNHLVVSASFNGFREALKLLGWE